MAVKHPYIAATGAISQVIAQLRKQFPVTVDASTLKKFAIAPNNESYLINTLKFIGLLDDQGKKQDAAKSVFLQHDDDKFQAGLAGLIKSSYSSLFDLYGDAAWNESVDRLISFFRQSDETSDVIGQRQARTFVALANVAAKRSDSTAAPKKGANPTAKPKAAQKPKAATPKTAGVSAASTAGDGQVITQPNGVALSVRIEVNLPAGADQETYDAIFKSIRANLMQ